MTTPESVYETWRPVVGYEGLYEVSDHGRLRSVTRVVYRKDGFHRVRFGKVLSQKVGDRGYVLVRMTKDGKETCYGLHRIVARAFLPERPSPEHQVNHKDGDKTNNRSDNLEWVTPKENTRHAYRMGLRRFGPHHPICKLSTSDVRGIRKMRSEGHSYASIARQYGVGSSCIWAVCNGRTWTHVA